MTAPSDWFVPLGADGGHRLFAFPHAGAGCAQMGGFARAAGSRGLSVWSANLPGRQARIKEPARTGLSGLADELTAALADRLDGRSYAVFGYCGGALLAYEVVRRLRDLGLRLPTRLVVASYEAPDIARRPRLLAALPSEALWAHLTETGGIPEALGADPRLRRVAEPALRADFTLLSGYRHEAGPPLPVPITVCFGTRDEETRRGALLGWRRHSTDAVDLRGVDSGHWLLDGACDELAAVVADSITDDVARSGR